MIIPAKLQKGDEIRVIAPARSLSMSFIQNVKEDAVKKFEKLGFMLTFGKHVEEIDEFSSTSIESRVEDLHQAFQDRSVKMLITVIGGFNSNQLLKYLDYEMIKNNPKIICGYSDITALTNAIFAKTGMVTYSGPHFFNFGDQKSFEDTWEYFEKCLLRSNTYKVEPSDKWSDDLWANDQNNRKFVDNDGYLVINEGNAEGTIVGGNLCTFNLLQGSEYMPSLKDSVLFIEDDYESDPATFDRDLQSLIHQPGFNGVRGIVIGRFQVKSGVTNEDLRKIINTKKELNDIPVLANADFGHTTPMITYPIGGKAKLSGNSRDATLEIVQH